MKRIVSVILAVCMLFSVVVAVNAEEVKPRYYNVPVEFTGRSGDTATEFADFMIRQDSANSDMKVYIKAEDFAAIAGHNNYEYDQTVLECAYVDSETGHVVRFRFGSADVSVFYIGGALSYTAPYNSLYEKNVAWIPFDFAAKLFNCSYSTSGDKLVITSSMLNPLSAATSIHNNVIALSFDWVSEAGYSEIIAVSNMTSAAIGTCAADLLSFEPAAWGSAILYVTGSTYAYDAEFAEDIAKTFISPAIQEVKAMADSGILTKFSDRFTALTKTLVTDGVDKGGEAVTKLFETAKKADSFDSVDGFFEMIEEMDPGILSDDTYKKLKKATNNKVFKIASSDLVTDLKDLYDFAGKDVAKGAEIVFTALDILNYILIFVNKSDRAVAALGQYAELSRHSEAQVFKEYAATTESDVLDAIIRYLGDNTDDIVNGVIPTGLHLELWGLAWDLITGYMPYLSQTLKSMEKNTLSQYAIGYQDESRTFYYDARSKCFSENFGNEKDLDRLINSVYAFLKFSFIARNAATAALDEMKIHDETVMTRATDKLTEKNLTVAELLIAMEEDPFLPSDVEEYNKTRNDTGLANDIARIGTLLDSSPTQDTVPKHEITIFPGEVSPYISEEEAIDLVKQALGKSINGIFGTMMDMLYEFEVVDHYSVDGTLTYVVQMSVQGQTDNYRFFVCADGTEVWLGLVESDGSYFVYPEIDLLNLSWSTLFSSIGDLYAQILEEQTAATTS